MPGYHVKYCTRPDFLGEYGELKEALTNKKGLIKLLNNPNILVQGVRLVNMECFLENNPEIGTQYIWNKKQPQIWDF